MDTKKEITNEEYKKLLLEAVDMLEKSIRRIPIDIQRLEAIKEECKITQNASVERLGIVEGGFYRFKMTLENGDIKIFNCDPDDVGFYEYCIPFAVDSDKNPDLRRRRLEMKKQSIQKAAEAAKECRDDGVEKSVTDVNKLIDSMRINHGVEK